MTGKKYVLKMICAYKDVINTTWNFQHYLGNVSKSYKNTFKLTVECYFVFFR